MSESKATKQKIVTTVAEAEKIIDENFGTSRRYFYYTKLKHIDTIMHEKAFLAQRVDKFNDETEGKAFEYEGEPKELYYGLCFSAASKESIPMWYLYSGPDGRGGRIEFRSGKEMGLFYENATFELKKRNPKSGMFESCGIELTKGRDITVKAGNILYIEEKEEDSNSKNIKTGNYKLKYRDGIEAVLSERELAKFKKEAVGFYKTDLWMYEKETRILIKLNPQIAATLDPKADYGISMSFGEAYKKMKIRFAPELHSIEEGLEGHKTLTKLYSDSRLNIDKKGEFPIFEQSKSAGKIEMHICRNCEKK